jgi:hypothetical protein
MAYYSLPKRTQMEQHVHQRIQDLIKSLSIQSKYVVYTLECGRDVPLSRRMSLIKDYISKTDSLSEYTTKLANKNEYVERIPEWHIKVGKADVLYYVGYTNNLGKRLSDHILGRTDGAVFTKIFQPNALIITREYNTQKKALKREKQLASSLNDFEGIHLNGLEYGTLPSDHVKTKWAKPQFRYELQEDDNKPSGSQRKKKYYLESFEESSENCLTKHILDREIKSLKKKSQAIGSDSRTYQDMWINKLLKHLKICSYSLNSGCELCAQEYNPVEQAIKKVRGYYRGAYLEYRGLIRRINSESLVFAYTK